MMTNHNYITLTFIGVKEHAAVEELMQCLFQFGCNITQSHVKTMGSHLSGMILVSGTWNAIAKLEAALPQLSERLHLLFLSRRTQQSDLRTQAVTYSVHATAKDRLGLIHHLLQFFYEHHINIIEMHTNVYPDFRSHIPMFNFTAMVEILDSCNLGRLREEFVLYCDEHNIDALLEPLKTIP